MTHNLKDLQSVFNIYVLVGYFTDITLIIKNTARKEKTEETSSCEKYFLSPVRTNPSLFWRVTRDPRHG